MLTEDFFAQLLKLSLRGTWTPSPQSLLEATFKDKRQKSTVHSRHSQI